MTKQIVRYGENKVSMYPSIDDQESKVAADAQKIMANLHLPEVKTRDLDTFYSKFDPFINGETNQPVTELAPLQHEIWEDQFRYIYREYPKAQKITVSTICLLEDIFHGLTDCMGYEMFIVAQTRDFAKIHLQDVRKMILASEYKDYLITKPIPGLLLKDEVTKTDEAYLWNPKKPLMPTHIYAKGFEAGQLISHKRVKHIHASDIAKSKLTATLKREAYGAMMSRLGLTHGSCVMESIMGGLDGPMNEQFEKYEEIVKAGIDLSKLSKREQMKYPMYCRKLKYTLGLEQGLVTPEFIEGERTRLGPLFGMFYEADAYESDQAWYRDEEWIQTKEASDFFARGY